MDYKFTEKVFNLFIYAKLDFLRGDNGKRRPPRRRAKELCVCVCGCQKGVCECMCVSMSKRVCVSVFATVRENANE